MTSRFQLLSTTLNHCLFESEDLPEAFERMGFVQADPIRTPARAQELILRQRVANYRAGDLDHQYPHLGFEELFLFAYGFGTSAIARFIYPRKARRPLSAFEKKTLAFVEEAGPTHPSDLSVAFGSKRVLNAWGGYSQRAKQALEQLHHLGYLRVARCEKGVRVYEIRPLQEGDRDPASRYEAVLLASLRAFGPASRRFLLSETAHFSELSPTIKLRNAAIDDLIGAGRIGRQWVDSIEYLLPMGNGQESVLPDRRARILAPFDPLVRDRSRFEHLWGWTYRFEAYTPAAKRQLGYYAMPLLWLDRIIGWANARSRNGTLALELGFVSGTRPKDRAFAQAVTEETERLAEFLGATTVNLAM